MANGSYQQGDELATLGHMIRSEMEKQPKTRRFANTITVGLGALVTIAGQVLAFPLDIPDWGMWVILAITLLGTLFGVSKTKNGWSPSQVQRLETWMAEYIDENHSLEGKEPALPGEVVEQRKIDFSDGVDAEELKMMVSKYLDHRKDYL